MVKKALPAFLLSCILVLSPGCTISTNWASEAKYADLHQAEDYSDDRSLRAEIDLKVGDLELKAGDPSKIYELDLHYNELAFTPDVKFRRSGEEALLNIRLEGSSHPFNHSGQNRLNLRLNREVSLDLNVSTGVSSNDLDLTGMTVKRLVLQCGVGETRLTMLDPTRGACDLVEISSGVGALEVIGLGNFNFRKLKFNGGVGESTLDFSGEWNEVGTVQVDIGIGSVQILLPRDIGAELTITKSFFSSSEIEGFVKRGDTYYSDNLDRVDRVLKLQIRSGIGEIEVDWL